MTERAPGAIVIGASLAGLLAARALSDRFERVTLIERDALPARPESRRGVPQDRHGHGLLAGGYDAILALIPEVGDDLRAAGAVTGDVIRDVRWFYFGSYKARFTSGLDGVLMSRPLLESVVRARVLARSEVDTIEGARVVGFLADGANGAIRGVRLEGGKDLHASLVVDASGRGSRTPAWLAELGHERPREDEVRVGIGYASRIYRRRPTDLGGDLAAVLAPTPPDRRVGFILAIEGQRWIVSLGGWLGDHAPTDDRGFLAFAKSLPRPDIFETIESAEPLSDIAVCKLPSNLRRRYERITRPPEGLAVLGDALCSFNPIYAQGMTSAAVQALALRDTLRESAGRSDLPARYFRRAARLLDNPWLLATNHDFRYREATGRRPIGTRILHRYVEAVQRAASHDEIVCRAFFDVANLRASPTRLFAPAILKRVWAGAAQKAPKK